MADPDFGQLYKQWVTQYYEDVYRWCYRYTKDPEESMDLTQETFLAAFRNIHKFRYESSPKTWLLTIASHKCIKSEKRRRQKEAWHATGTMPQDAASAESVYMRQVADESVWRAVAALKPFERMAMILYYDENLSYEEICRVLGKSLAQVKNYLHRAREHVRLRLEREEKPR